MKKATTLLFCLAAALTSLLAGACMPSAYAEEARDIIVKVPKGNGLFSINLTTRIFSPPGDGPFPLVVLNHGKAHGNPAFQKDRAMYGPAMEFVKRGYAVIVPTRQGFGSSGGTYIETHCDIESSGQVQADDVEVAIQYARGLPYIDSHTIVVIGQSQGGLTTMALGTRNLPGVLGLVNFAGGLRVDSCASWQHADVTAFANYGAKVKVPSLWMYGDNDSYFPPPIPQEAYAAYTAAGGRALLVDFGTFGSDAHEMFSSYEGKAIWLPQVEKFFISLGLPFEVKYELRKHPQGQNPEDPEALPSLNQVGIDGYHQFLWQSPPRAFVVSANGHWAYAHGPEAQQEALNTCTEKGGRACELYVVDFDLVKH